MTYATIPDSLTIDHYRAPTVRIECRRCQRDVPEVSIDALRRRYGGQTTVVEAARQVAAHAARPCGLASGGELGQCSVRALEPPVWFWANLYQALHGGWRAVLVCHRHLEALKRAHPCPGDILLDIPTLAAALGHDFKLSRLPGTCECPKCHTNAIQIRWEIPDSPPPPHAPAERATVLKLRESRSQKARQTLRVIGGRGG